ncbi:hypothetical protein ACTA71_001324 [Dictyostelium dimigraforme]
MTFEYYLLIPPGLPGGVDYYIFEFSFKFKWLYSNKRKKETPLTTVLVSGTIVSITETTITTTIISITETATIVSTETTTISITEMITTTLRFQQLILPNDN